MLHRVQPTFAGGFLGGGLAAPLLAAAPLLVAAPLLAAAPFPPALVGDLGAAGALAVGALVAAAALEGLLGGGLWVKEKGGTSVSDDHYQTWTTIIIAADQNSIS